MVDDDELANLLDSLIANTDKGGIPRMGGPRMGGPPRHQIRPNTPPMSAHYRANFMPQNTQ